MVLISPHFTVKLSAPIYKPKVIPLTVSGAPVVPRSVNENIWMHDSFNVCPGPFQAVFFIFSIQMQAGRCVFNTSVPSRCTMLTHQRFKSCLIAASKCNLLNPRSSQIQLVLRYDVEIWELEITGGNVLVTELKAKQQHASSNENQEKQKIWIHEIPTSECTKRLILLYSKYKAFPP